MDVYPIHHKNLIFNLITDYDLSFKEVRAILDDLLDKGVFKEQEEAEVGKFFDLEIENIQYVIDVNGCEVVVYRRTEIF
jgi:predicted transcriptional regulator